MAYDASDAVTARALLEDALALTSKPTLAPEQIDRLFVLAETLDADGGSTWPISALNGAAARGWMLKAGLTADAYDLSGGNGKSLTESQWHDHCVAMADAYRTGKMSVEVEVRATSGRIGSIALMAATTGDREAW